MHDSFFDLVKESMSVDSSIIFGNDRLDSSTVENLITLNLINRLTETEIEGEVFNYAFEGVVKEFTFELEGDEFRCEPVDRIGKIYRKKIQEILLYSLNYKIVFEVLSLLNNFSPVGNYIPGSKKLFTLGTCSLAEKKIVWIHTLDSNATSEEALRIFSKGFDIILISNFENGKSLTEPKEFVSITLPTAKSSWEINIIQFINAANGFMAADFVELSKKSLVLDTINESLFVFGRHIPRNSIRDYKYVSTLVTSKHGLKTKVLASKLSGGSDLKIVHNDRRELKEAIESAFSDNPDLCKAALFGLGLDPLKKGDLCKINFEANSVVKF